MGSREPEDGAETMETRLFDGLPIKGRGCKIKPSISQSHVS